MKCVFCTFVDQLVANFALMLDHVGNTLLLGDPNETIRLGGRLVDGGRDRRAAVGGA
jgi:hypothetical protein